MHRGLIVVGVVCALLAVQVVCAAEEEVDNPFGKRVLAVLETDELKHSHSIFFKSIEERGYKVDYATASDRGLALRKYGEWLYDHLILFAPSADDLDGISERDLIDFIDEGKNMLVATDSNIGSLVASLGSECSAEFDERESTVIDHFNYDVSDSDYHHNLIVADNVVDAPIILGAKVEAPILFRGVGQDIEEDSPLIFPVLSAYSTSYSHVVGASVDQLHVAGKKTVLVSALQARNNARVVFAGSLEMFSDKFFNSAAQKQGGSRFEKSGNENFCKQLVRWTFKERGVLRVKSVSHHKVGETSAPSVYRIKDDVEYHIEVEEYKGKKWVPYTANDMQMEFIRLDPHIRANLKADGNGMFSTQFKVPDVYGYFTFKVEYTRKGYGNLVSISRLPVRPFRHNEYERFIGAAYPYYVSVFSMVVGLFIFSSFFLYHREKQPVAAHN